MKNRKKKKKDADFKKIARLILTKLIEIFISVGLAMAITYILESI